ncbi:MAG: matrixin family metalloprotease [Myxococcota bacterium]|nr:matrixin family metalloprotease [Myxococcota bacterium]
MLLLVLPLGLGDCARNDPPPVPYRPTRQDYAAFAEAWPDLLEPNYLPFMVHRQPRDDAGGDLLFFCRWPDEAMPIPVWVTPAEIPESLQDEFTPRDPKLYTRAARQALSTWERELEGLVRFRRVTKPEQARLTLRLVAERAPEPDPEHKVLGTTKLAEACRVGGLDPDAERLDVGFEVAELALYLADEFGLLAPDQVEWIALHEIGHALGMRGHSPIPADLMFEVARDRVTVTEGLSPEDVNSFVSLYQLPNGTIFARALDDPDPPPPPAPGPPELALAPHVDTRLGFELRPPAGWTRLPTAQGMAAVHGTTWDYVASFQVVVHRFERVEDYVERYGAYYAGRGRVTPPARLAVNGHRALQVEIDRFDAARIEQVTVVESGDGRVVVLIGDCPRDVIGAYRPWFRLALGSLRIRPLPEEAWPARRGGG